MSPDEEDQGAAKILLRTYSAGPVSPICYDLKGRELATRCNPRWLDKPQTPVMCVIRVWPYATFIVFASSSSGKTSGQNLEVLNIIRTSIWNIFKIIQKIMKKYDQEIVCLQGVGEKERGKYALVTDCNPHACSFPFHLSFSYRRPAAEASFDIKRLSWSRTMIDLIIIFFLLV